VKENDITLHNVTRGSGIYIDGGMGIDATCNKVESLSNNNRKPHGIVVWDSSVCDIIENEVENVDRGIGFYNNSNMQTVKGNRFHSGKTGIYTNWNIGSQEFKTNHWIDANWTESSAESTLSFIENNLMRFLIDSDDNSGIPSGYTVWPSNIDGQGWFLDPNFGSNEVLAGCQIDIIESTSELNADDLESLCDFVNGRDSLNNCNENWVSNFELYSLIKHNEIDYEETKHDCLTEFVSDLDSSMINVFYQIDSVLFSGTDSLTHLTLDSLYTDYNNQIESEEFSGVDSTFTSILDFILIQDSLGNSKALTIDSLLLEVTPDSCDVSGAFLDVYSYVNEGPNMDDLRNDTGTQSMLHGVAIQCPDEYGHVVFTARQYMRQISTYDYEQHNCQERSETRESNPMKGDEDIQVKIYPNPVSENLNVELIGLKTGTIDFYTLTGKKMRSYNISSQITTVDVGDLYKGVYLVKVYDQSNKIQSIEKVIIQ